jgi:hypothetical protein
MRRTIACFSLVVAILAVGCGGGGVEADLKKSGDDLRKDAASMSVAELEKYSKEMQEKSGGGEPSQAEMEKWVKVMEVTGIYTTELMKKKMK